MPERPSRDGPKSDPGGEAKGGPADRPETDPLAARSERAFRAFGWYLRWYFWRKFHAVRLSRAGVPEAAPDRPLIIYSNHPSWWDPAMYMLLCGRLHDPLIPQQQGRRDGATGHQPGRAEASLSRIPRRQQHAIVIAALRTAVPGGGGRVSRAGVA